MTLSKETLESPGAQVKTSGSSATATKNDNSRLRADAVSLDVPVKVHGSRVTDVVMGATPHTEPFEEETSTMIVFPHGGVLRMATTVGVGQMLVITNSKTKQDAICRVVKVRAYSNTQAYVEVEFTHRLPGYWGVHFSAEDEQSAIPAAPPIPARPEPTASASETRTANPVVSTISVKMEDHPKVHSTQALPESAFVSIGMQEKVQPAASSAFPPPVAPTIQPPPMPSKAPSTIQPPIQPAARLPELVTTLPSVAPPSLAVEPAAPIAPAAPVAISTPAIGERPSAEPVRSAGTFGTLTGGSLSSSTQEMGTRLGQSVSGSTSEPSTSSKNGLVIAACVAFLLVGAAGSAWYFRQHPAGSPASPAPSVAENNANLNSGSSPNTAVQNSQTSAAPSAPTTPPVESAIQAPPAAPAQRNVRRPAESPSENAPHEVAEAAPAAAEPKSSPMGNIGMTVIGARPVTKGNSGGNVAAPDLAPAGLPTSSSLPGAISSVSPNLAPPSQPSHVGGQLVAARLLHSTPPVYPASAKKTGFEGDVIIKAQIDETGNVGGMEVVSGMIILRQAALDALKSWKYQPATLNGNPVASQINVTIQFRK